MALETPRYLIVLAQTDPVARAVAERFGTGASTGEHVEGAPIRRLTDGVVTLDRPGRHVYDEGLDRLLPRAYRERGVPLVFPSIHRSEQGPLCFTVHPLGNWGDEVVVGGRPRCLVPAAPRLMAAALRALSASAAPLGLPATFEATHHGPSLGLPAFFVEIGGGPTPESPPSDAVAALAEVLRGLREDPTDRIAVGVGGGHYMPHFGDLVRRRRWAFGHLVPRHVVPLLDPELARAALDGTPGAEGIVFARAADAAAPAWEGLAPRLRDADAPTREI
jgi:D-aminoacyl-tRNA deacylase